MQAKIRELYKASQASQEVADMMGPNGQPINPYAGMAYANNLTQLMGLGGAYSNIHQQSLQGRNPYDSGYPPNSAQHMGGHTISYISGYPGHPGHPGMFISGHQQVNLLITSKRINLKCLKGFFVCNRGATFIA